MIPCSIPGCYCADPDGRMAPWVRPGQKPTSHARYWVGASMILASCWMAYTAAGIWFRIEASGWRHCFLALTGSCDVHEDQAAILLVVFGVMVAGVGGLCLGSKIYDDAKATQAFGEGRG